MSTVMYVLGHWRFAFVLAAAYLLAFLVVIIVTGSAAVVIFLACGLYYLYAGVSDWRLYRPARDRA